MPSPDRGLATERTELAWERSALSYVVLAAVMLAVAAHRHADWMLAVSVALVAVGAAVRHHAAARPPGPQPRALALVSLATTLAGLAAAVAVLVRL
jgi:uncharacterized membrane protein YidH (DUF202 family)